MGITTASIEKAILQRYGRVIDYDLSLIAGFSTGYLGVQGSVGASLFPLTKVERVIIYDCLYATLKSALDRVKAARPNARIIAYVVTEGGNSFQPNVPASFSTLSLGGNPAWNYINLMGDTSFYAVASARLVNEARPSDARILNPLPATYEAALNGMVGVLPARSTVISNDALFRKVQGPAPANAVVLATFAADKNNASQIRNFTQPAFVTTTRRCIGRAQLLGWPAPPGEEWHDMLLVEFAWEYLT